MVWPRGARVAALEANLNLVETASAYLRNGAVAMGQFAGGPVVWRSKLEVAPSLNNPAAESGCTLTRCSSSGALL